MVGSDDVDNRITLLAFLRSCRSKTLMLEAWRVTPETVPCSFGAASDRKDLGPHDQAGVKTRQKLPCL